MEWTFDERAGRRENVAGYDPFYTVDKIDLNKIVEIVEIEPDQQIVAGFGPCRVGTKAQLFTMAVSGYLAYEQPFKSAYRCLGHGIEPEPFRPDGPVTYLKETLGPYSPGESLVNPLSLLHEATNPSWMTEQLELILLLRDPYDTWHSWLDVWGDTLDPDTLFEHFCLAFQTTRDITTEARETGLSIRRFDYGLNRDPESAYEALFSELGLEQSPVVSGWQEEPNRSRLKNNFVPFREPEIFLPEGIREQALASDGLHYRTYDPASLDRQHEIKERVAPVYEELVETIPDPENK